MANGISAQINLIKSFSFNCLVKNCPLSISPSLSLALARGVCFGVKKVLRRSYEVIFENFPLNLLKMF